MQRAIIYILCLLISVFIGVDSSMSLNEAGNLNDCIISTNCARVEWSYKKSKDAFKKLVDIASSLPRVNVVESNNNYWHGIVRSLIFRFPDDLEILHIPGKNMIQVRSASRIGLGDLGVNQKRINKLHSALQELL